MMFDSWELTAIDASGFYGIRDEHIEKVAALLLTTGLVEIDRTIFENHCFKCGIDPRNFIQIDFESLQEKLNK